MSGGLRTTARTVVGGLVAMVGSVALVGQAARATGVIAHQRSAPVVADARLDDAYYACIATQAHSLISPSTPVRYRPDVGIVAVVVLNKAVAPWMRLSPAGTEPAGWLGLRRTSGPHGCLGDQVTLSTRGADGRWVVRGGHGAHIPGQGPPPAPPL